MAEKWGKYIVYTADDEMPDCLMCDNCDNDYDCSRLCGPAYGWAGYKHTANMEEE